MGAAVGALITLCLHPASRAFMMGVTSRASPVVLKNCLDSNAATLQSPTNLPEAGLWMQMAATRIVKHDKLQPAELDTIIQIAKTAQQRDETNAFWPQMQAVVFQEENQTSKAIEAWTRASTCLGWDDYQTKRLFQARDAMMNVTGVKESWQLAYLYYARSDDVSVSLKNLARVLLATADLDTAKGLTLRYATLINGDLVRKHAHSEKSSINAMDIVDLTAFPSDGLSAPYGTVPGPKKLWSGQAKVVNNLNNILNKPDWAQQTRKIYKENESWRAFTVHDSNPVASEAYAIGSILSSSVASAVVVVAAVGCLFWLIGRLVAWRLTRSKEIKPYVAVIIAVILGSLVDFLTADLAAAFAAAMCAAFLTVAPDRSRKVRPSDLGPLFSFLAIVLGVICSALLTVYLVGATPAANAILTSLGVPSEYVDKPLLAGMSVVSFGLVLLMAPIWAVVHRIGTPYVLSLSLMKFGSFIAVSGLCLSIILGPLSVYADQKIEATFFELVSNEPVHYYLHQ